MKQRRHRRREGNKSFVLVIVVYVRRCVTHARPICCSAHIWGLLAKYVPSKKPELRLCVHISLALPRTFDGTLLDIDKWSALSAFGLSLEMSGSVVGCVP